MIEIKRVVKNIGEVKRHKIVISVCCILIVSLIVFLPVLKNEFIGWDDNQLVYENLVIRNLTWNNLKEIFTSFYVGNYIPLTILSFSLEYRFLKLNPYGYHMSNLILHLLNSILVFWLIYMLSNKFSISALVALLFGIHPTHVEAVAWITGRKDVLYSFFFLLSIISYLYYQRDRAVKNYFLSLFFFIFSLLSKSIAITMPFVLLLCDYLGKRKFDRYLILEKIPYVGIATLVGIIAIWGQRSVNLVGPKSFSEILYNTFLANYLVVFYLSKIAIPIKLSAVYPFPGAGDSFIKSPYLISSITVLALLSAVIYLRKHSRKITFGSLFFLLTILPVIQPIAGEAAAGDRHTYLPAIGLFYLLGYGLYSLYELKIRYTRMLKIALRIAVVGLMAILSILSWQRCHIWKDGITMWSDVLEKYPDLVMGYYNRGIAYYNNRKYDNAIADYSQVIRMDSNFAAALNNRGMIYFQFADYEKALADFTQALKIHPQSVQANYNRGLTYGFIGEYEKAIADFTRALMLDPKYSMAYAKRALSFYAIKEYENAWQDVRNAENLGCRIDPNFIKDLTEMSGKRNR